MAYSGTSKIVFEKTTDAAKRTHICKVCSKAFKRAEHCIRHQRGHTQERPFACKFCRRRYSRRDLLVRHERTLHAGEDPPEPTDPIPEDVADSSKPSKPRNSSSAKRARPNPKNRQGDGNDEIVGMAIPNSPGQDDENGISPSQSPESDDTDSDRVLPVPAETVNENSKSNSLPSAIQWMAPFTEPHNTFSIRPTHSQFDSSNFTTDFVPSQEIPPMTEYPNGGFQELISNEIGDLPDLGFLDFFDPMLGLPADQTIDFSLPALNGTINEFSPMETFSVGERSIQRQPSQSSGNAHITIPSGPIDPHNERQLASQSGALPSKDIAITSPSSSLSSRSSASIQIAKSTPSKQPTLVVTEEVRLNLQKDLTSRLFPTDLHSFKVPSAGSLQKCLNSFTDAFHIHMPLFHLYTLDLLHTPSPLILVMFAIGALYRLERKNASILYEKASKAMNTVKEEKDDLDKMYQSVADWSPPVAENIPKSMRPLWQSQTRLLLTLFECLSGNTMVVKNALSHINILAGDFRNRLSNVKASSIKGNRMSWYQWVERESIKRLLYGNLFLSNLLTITYGVPPGFSIINDGQLEMPGDQILWDAPTEEKWQALTAIRDLTSPLSVRDAAARLFHENCAGDLPDVCWTWSPFACCVVMTAVSIQVWHITQGCFFLDQFASLSGLRNPRKSVLAAQTEAALSRCRTLIKQARNGTDYTWNEMEGPLLFNSLALLRVTYCRAFTNIGSADRTMLLKESQKEIADSVKTFIAMPQDRGEYVTKAVARAIEGFMIPIKSGPLLIQKTAALSWAVEHALAGWDAVLLVAKWVNEVQTLQSKGITVDKAEAQVIEELELLLTENGCFDGDTELLAPILLRFWASFYIETWVWGITPRMGYIMCEFAKYYESMPMKG